MCLFHAPFHSRQVQGYHGTHQAGDEGYQQLRSTQRGSFVSVRLINFLFETTGAPNPPAIKISGLRLLVSIQTHTHRKSEWHSVDVDEGEAR